MNLKEKLDSALSEDRLHLLHLIADVAGSLGFPVYIVGGSVRDLMLGCTVNDFDLTVEGDAGELAETILMRLGGKIVVHSQFGTARWTLTESTLHRLGVPLFQSDDFPPYLDFVSARSEAYSSPGALPSVKRSSIDDDLHRRDFTINAMAVRLDGINFGELLDPLDGQKDIDQKLIRVLHTRSLIDDPTRMFRAVRYARRYGFQIEYETRLLFNDEALTTLSQLSGERIRNEFDLIFEEDAPDEMLEQVKELGLLAAIHPDLIAAEGQLLAALIEPREGFGEFTVPDILTFKQTLGWILYLISLPENKINPVAQRLTFPALLARSVRAASALMKDISTFKDWKSSQWTSHLDELPSIAVYAVWLILPEEKPLHDYLTKWQFIKPFTSGTDLKNRGLEPGSQYREILARLRAAWLDGEVKTGEEENSLLEKLIK